MFGSWVLIEPLISETRKRQNGWAKTKESNREERLARDDQICRWCNSEYIPSFTRSHAFGLLSTSKHPLIISWTRSKAEQLQPAVALLLILSQCESLQIFSVFCIQVLIIDLCESLRGVCMYNTSTCLLMYLPVDEKSDFFPPFLLGCGTSRSRCTGIQINSIERSLIVPLRPARKLKLTMGVRERKRMRAAQSSKEEEAGITKGKKTT